MDALIIAIASGVVPTALTIAALVRERRNRGRLQELLDASRQETKSLVDRFQGVVDAEARKAQVLADADEVRASAAREQAVLLGEIEAQKARAIAEATELRSSAALEQAALSDQVETLRSSYAMGLARYEELNTAVRSLEENLQDIELGMYRPHYTYSDSEQYKSAIDAVRDERRYLVKTGQAASCGTSWTVGGSQREGERMVKQNEKLILRAFNAESEAAIANVSWNNYAVMEARVTKTYDALNKLGSVLQVMLSERYRDACLRELKLVFEAAEKRQQEREEQRRQRVAQKEEERVQKELQREQERAADDEDEFGRALAKAQRELAIAQEGERQAMMARIQRLETDLAEAQERRKRAMAQAELTRVGHVYVISNIGAFGHGVVKIGMTRRLEPEERVRELGDASVPFPFDIHALVYCDDAPGLETKLHTKFWEKRVNWANDRKEFFRVTLEELQSALVELGLASDMSTVPEAREFRQTVVACAQSRQPTAETASALEHKRFAADPFAPSPS